MSGAADREPAAPPLESKRFEKPTEALGCATLLLSTARPFDRMRFGALARALNGQIHRGHYLFAAQGRRLVGYVGWALCTEEVGRGWAHGRYRPSHEDCLAGDCFVGLTWYGESPRITFFLMRRCRALYPGVKVFGRREYGDGRPPRPMEWVNPVPSSEGSG
jgi:hemolysin-activating ACP:hemolysin acyltransferase